MGRYAARAGIGSFPTPVEATPELGRELGVPNLAVKREDAAGEQYGGNKIRKLDCLFGEALLQGCDRVFTSGGVGSHHVLATATYARELGLEPHAAQFPQPPTEHVRENLRALAGLDPTLALVPAEALLPLYLIRARLAARFDDECYYVPPGGSSPVGTLGFVEAAHELAAQIDRGEIPEPDVVVVPTSSGGTLAGLRVGFDLAGIDARPVGVRVVEWYLANRLTIARLANQTAALIDENPGPYGREDIHLLSGYLGDGYAEPTAEGERVTDVAGEFGLQLDPTYTAKTVAAIAGEFDDEQVLYWHTLSHSRPEPLSRERAIERLPDGYRQFL
jgi:D-cysteine desulfhydrase